MRQIVRNALVAAIYVAFSYLWGWLATGPAINVRLATALYVLPALDPALLWGPAVGNALTTLLTGGVVIDAGLGLLVGLLTGILAVWVGRRLGSMVAPLVVFVVPTLFVPLWVAWLYHAPLTVVYGAVALGQALSAVAAWVLVLPAARAALGRR